MSPPKFSCKFSRWEILILLCTSWKLIWKNDLDILFLRLTRLGWGVWNNWGFMAHFLNCIMRKTENVSWSLHCMAVHIYFLLCVTEINICCAQMYTKYVVQVILFYDIHGPRISYLHRVLNHPVHKTRRPFNLYTRVVLGVYLIWWSFVVKYRLNCNANFLAKANYHCFVFLYWHCIIIPNFKENTIEFNWILLAPISSTS